MRKILYMLLCVIPLSVLAADDTSKKKYPPYPDVWGYELPEPREGDRNAAIRLYARDDGDYEFTFVKQRVENKRKDGACCNYSYVWGNRTLFGRNEITLSESMINRHGKERKEKRISYDKYRKVVFRDGSTIERAGRGHPKCHVSFPYHIVIFNYCTQARARNSSRRRCMASFSVPS